MKVGWSSLLLLPLAAAVWAAPPRYVSSPEIIINARPANDTTVEHVQLWVSTDDGQSWHQPDTVPADGSATRYTADRDGRYDFYLVLENSAGTSGPAPQAGTKSAITVVVDTIPPLLQVHDAVSPDNNESVVINVTLIEENLGEDGLRVFYRTPSEIWQDGGPAFHNGELATWDAPADLSDDAEIRLVATDLAGNRSATEPLSLADVVVTTQPTTVPAVCDPEPITPPTVEIDPVQVADVEMDTVLPPEIEPFSPTLPDTPAESATADRTAEVNPDGLDTSEVEHLRELASQFMQRGDYRLALARLQDAIEVEPGNADLLVDLGSALYRQNHYDEARERFQKAADIMPSHVGALDGLALVAATQKQYPQARAHLQRLQELLPDSGVVWLRTGDIEHKLGHTAAALQAWQRARQVASADTDLMARAKRRLDYFSPNLPRPVSPPADQPWPNQNNPRPSSSSTETTSTRDANR